MAHALIMLEVLAAVLLVWKAVERFTRMSDCTRFAYAAAWAVVGGTAAATIAAAFDGELVADWRTAMLLVALAWLALIDRRDRAVLRRPGSRRGKAAS